MAKMRSGIWTWKLARNCSPASRLFAAAPHLHAPLSRIVGTRFRIQATSSRGSKRDLVIFLTDNLEYFQQFELVKIYYDNGQQMVTEALHGALDFILSKESVLYRAASSKEYRLSQVADCVCALELVNLKFLNNELTETDTKMFGTNYSAFKKNHLRHIRRKLL